MMAGLVHFLQLKTFDVHKLEEMKKSMKSQTEGFQTRLSLEYKNNTIFIDGWVK